MTVTNSKPARKQLCDQLDRLDGIIDTLADGLNQAVVDACREGARAAVREVLMELISNPDLMATVRATAAPATAGPSDESTPPTPPASLSFWSRVKSTVKSLGQAVTGVAKTLTRTVENAVQPATDALQLTGTTRTVVAVALGVGLTAGAVSLVCPTWMAAALTATGGF